MGNVNAQDFVPNDLRSIGESILPGSSFAGKAIEVTESAVDAVASTVVDPFGRLKDELDRFNNRNEKRVGIGGIAKDPTTSTPPLLPPDKAPPAEIPHNTPDPGNKPNPTGKGPAPVDHTHDGLIPHKHPPTPTPVPVPPKTRDPLLPHRDPNRLPDNPAVVPHHNHPGEDNDSG